MKGSYELQTPFDKSAIQNICCLLLVMFLLLKKTISSVHLVFSYSQTSIFFVYQML